MWHGTRSDLSRPRLDACWKTSRAIAPMADSAMRRILQKISLPLWITFPAWRSPAPSGTGRRHGGV